MWPTIGTIALGILLIIACAKYEKDIKILMFEKEELESIIRGLENELRRVRRGEE